MKKETWKTVIQVIVSILTAALTALGTTSCMGHGPIAFWEKKSRSLLRKNWQHHKCCQSFFLPEMCHNLNIFRNFAHANVNDIEQTGKHHIYWYEQYVLTTAELWRYLSFIVIHQRIRLQEMYAMHSSKELLIPVMNTLCLICTRWISKQICLKTLLCRRLHSSALPCTILKELKYCIMHTTAITWRNLHHVLNWTNENRRIITTIFCKKLHFTAMIDL